MNIEYLRKGVKCSEVFFNIPLDFDRKKYGMVIYHDLRSEFDDGCKVILEDTSFLTVVNNIDKQDDVLIGDFDKNVRYEIKRAIKEKTGHVFLYSRKESIPDDILEEINRQYLAMYNSKGIDSAPVYKKLKLYSKQKILAVSLASINGITHVWHVYIVGNGISRLLYSVSNFRNTDIDKNLVNAIGRANRMSHYYDMICLRDSCGIIEYDWGGCGLGDDVKSISDFKRGFGGMEKVIVQKVTLKKGLLSFFYTLYRKIR